MHELLTRIFHRRGDLQNLSFVLLFRFSAGSRFCAPKPARMQSPETLVASAKRQRLVGSKLSNNKRTN